MIRHALPALALLGLAACGGRDPGPVTTVPESPEVAACREEARTAPNPRDFGREQNLANATRTEQLRQERLAVEQRAFNDCLRRRGLTRGGGVEAVRPSRTLF
jgi:hypothetical protein